ncbi:hypothetical protein BPOR_1006g00010 [Botrytis porri]|uniref:Endonuclease/exonuclease/phosphatase domain-containing protein n=1 Tax=Botrytis porri TaxID=87229 RepID=A0A4Z1K771_9HELO|nr:hypothetical protein BPOR_1006g00010 [Botrytis porri]
MSKRRSVREVRTAGRRETQAVRKEKVPATTPSRQPQVVIPRPPAPGARVTTYENEWQLVDRSPKRARPEEGPSNSPIHTPGRNPPRRANKGVAGEAGMDIICVQEPRLYENSATQNHAAYDRFQPIDTWGATDGPERGPRVITYVRKGGNLKVRQMRQTGSRDLLWVNINGYSILNAYRAPLEPRTMEYILGLEIAPGTGTVVGGDFNAKYDLWEPGVPTAGQGDALAQWASDQGMEYIGTPGAPTHARGHVLDLTFSNLATATTVIDDDLHSGSDHVTQVTTISDRGISEYEQAHIRIRDSDLPCLAGIMANRLANLQNPDLRTTYDIDTLISGLTNALSASVEAVGQKDHKPYRSSPWWTDECREAHRAHTQARRTGTTDEMVTAQHDLQRVVRASKRAYWTKRLDGVQDDQELYKVMNWHKLTPEAALKAPPLVIEGQEITDTREKAEALFTAHVKTRIAKAMRVASHIRSIAHTAHGPSAVCLRKAIITCVLPVALFGSEVWFDGLYKQRPNAGHAPVGTRIKKHVDLVSKTIHNAARGALPVYKTTPTTALLVEAGLPAGIVALEQARLRFAFRLQTVDAQHLLVDRLKPCTRKRGRGTGTLRGPITKLQRMGRAIPATERPRLLRPHFSPECRTDPTNGMSKEDAAKAFKDWWDLIPREDYSVFSDGSEQYDERGHRIEGNEAADRLADQDPGSIPEYAPTTCNDAILTRSITPRMSSPPQTT